YPVKFCLESVSGTFQAGETIEGDTSGFTATIDSISGKTITATIVSGEPTGGEGIEGGTSGATATLDYFTPVPLARLWDSETEVGWGIVSFARTDIWAENLIVEDYNGSASSGGIRINDGGRQHS